MAERKTLRCVLDPGIVELAEGLKALSDPNRLRILCLLLKGERCVCEVERELGISQQLASHHLNVLKEAGVLRGGEEGASAFFSGVEGKLDGMTDTFLRYIGYRDRLGEGADAPCRAPAPATRERPGEEAAARGGKRR